MRERCILLLILVIASVALPTAAAAQTFTILTQNMLRFGHGQRLLAQCNAIDAVSGSVDIIVLQEVMTSGYPCLKANNTKNVNGTIPANFSYVTSAAKGRSSYVEYYGILYRTTPRNNQQIALLGQNDALSSTATFMRPPYGAQFSVTDNSSMVPKTCNVWVVDIHSIFGKAKSGRQAEAASVQNIYANLMASGNTSVIVAGDWNLAADDVTGFGWVAGKNAAIQPNVLTSLTTSGVPSSAYDHAINTSNVGAVPTTTLSNIALYYGGFSMQTWRTNVSDHMGVKADVTLSC